MNNDASHKDIAHEPVNEQAKARLEVIVAVIAGRMGVDEACARLGVGPARFYQLRERALAGAVEALSPRASGRPAKSVTPEDRERQALEARVRELEEDLQAALVRTEIALAMPEQLRGIPGKKNRKRRTKPAGGGSCGMSAT